MQPTQIEAPRRWRWLLPAIFAALVPLGCKQNNTATSTADPVNFHVLEAGRAYRSGQPTGDQLQAAIQTYGIRTVINLRGANPGKDWYDAEAAVCAAQGVKLSDHKMSSQALPSGEALAGIVNTLQTAEYPILIHCSGGADRSGAIAAIYRMLIRHEDREAAKSELSSEYLHFSSYAPWMDTLVSVYEPTPEWLTWYAAHLGEIQCTVPGASRPASGPADGPNRQEE